MFLEKYAYYLKEYSDTKFINEFLKLNKNELKIFNNAIYQMTPNQILLGGLELDISSMIKIILKKELI